MEQNGLLDWPQSKLSRMFEKIMRQDSVTTVERTLRPLLFLPLNETRLYFFSMILPKKLAPRRYRFRLPKLSKGIKST